MQHTRLLAVGALFAAPLFAQTAFVSPVAAAAVDGNASNSFPWNTTIICRYMQVHSDTVGTPMVVTQVAQRRNGTSTPPGGSRTVDLELFMGESVAWNRISYVFAANYIGGSSQVVTRQVVNIGPLTGAGNPAPFEMLIPLSTPFAYTGVNSLAWEAVQYSNAASGTFTTVDTHQGTATNGSSSLTGAGCVATGQTSTMDLQVQHVDRGGAYQVGFYVRYAPAGAPTVLYLGSSNPNLSFPGLCGNLYTDLAAVLASGVADANGDLRETASTATSSYPYAPWTFVMPNVLGAPTLYVQAHAFDAGRTDPVPICNSNGRSFAVPAPNIGTISEVSRLYNFQFQGPSYPNATPLTLDHGYAAVTEFTY
ncbi:MAG: hypothetical protein R3F56_19880 [Planctomycetota bacterium]